MISRFGQLDYESLKYMPDRKDIIGEGRILVKQVEYIHQPALLIYEYALTMPNIETDYYWARYYLTDLFKDNYVKEIIKDIYNSTKIPVKYISEAVKILKMVLQMKNVLNGVDILAEIAPPYKYKNDAATKYKNDAVETLVCYSVYINLYTTTLIHNIKYI